MSEELKEELEEVTKEEPQESMENYEDEIEASFKRMKYDDMVKGTIIGISEEEVTVDLQSFTEGIIKKEDLSADPDFMISENLSIGDEISAIVIREDDGEGHVLLSMREANEIIAWEKLKEYMENESVIPVKIKGIVNKGVIAYVEGIRGFIPASKLSLNYVEDLDEWLLKDIEVRVITVESENKRLVMSAKEILREKADEERKHKISNVQVGLVTEGVVESIKPYGAFVNIGNGLSGLLHISQISEKRIKTPDAVLNEGDKITVKIIAVKEGKISLSMKALADVAATEIEEEVFEMPKAEEATTTLGDLFKNIKL